MQALTHSALRVLLLCCMLAVQARELPNEHEVKAAFLVNMTRFVEWPSEVTNRFTFCILDDERLEASLRTFSVGKTAASREIAIRRLRPSESVLGCQVVYAGSLQNVKSKGNPTIERWGVLTVSDSSGVETPGVEKNGVMITLSFNSGRLEFAASLEAIRGTGLRLSANLLRLARNFRNEGFRAAQ
jgi:hypothetical protein